jgi:UDP-N-acetyl-alpha-D-muramoyl-L-alanyl-L-glutamate epimerase
MSADAAQSPIVFDPTAFTTFRFVGRELHTGGRVTLRYALDDAIEFTEELSLPVPAEIDAADRARVEGLLSLLHWVAGVSYFKTALPPRVTCDSGAPGPAAAALLEALYSEGLAEMAYTSNAEELPRPSFARLAADGAHVSDGPRARPGDQGPHPQPGDQNQPARSDDPGSPRAAGGQDTRTDAADQAPQRVLVPVGGGKDSAVALEVVRRASVEVALFSVGDAAPIARTVAASGLERLLATRTIDPQLLRLNAAGALNGHVPVTAIVSCIALLTAALNGFDAVAMANERSASAGNVRWQGVEVNHQFSKGWRAERLLSAAAAETGAGVRLFSVLRPASELAIARAFAGMERYHEAFTSCNAIFRIDPALRSASWCGDCPKCRFVFLALAPFSEPAHLREIFGADLLDDERQFDGFALLTATGGHKPFECVGEECESVAAIRLLAREPRWSGHHVVARLVAEVLPSFAPDYGDPASALALADEHAVPPALLTEVRALLSA